ncbi:hypothetical protein VNI00_004793 [Paramarasmius palmivorus]|uniref:PUM-HD domain-containing protein n=1 Tax=Paramarasmius palmivorus TaxID=297713 RepID=A0AAW0DJ30_9AGAR
MEITHGSTTPDPLDMPLKDATRFFGAVDTSLDYSHSLLFQTYLRDGVVTAPPSPVASAEHGCQSTPAQFASLSGSRPADDNSSASENSGDNSSQCYEPSSSPAASEGTLAGCSALPNATASHHRTDIYQSSYQSEGPPNALPHHLPFQQPLPPVPIVPPYPPLIPFPIIPSYLQSHPPFPVFHPFQPPHPSFPYQQMHLPGPNHPSFVFPVAAPFLMPPPGAVPMFRPPLPGLASQVPSYPPGGAYFQAPPLGNRPPMPPVNIQRQAPPVNAQARAPSVNVPQSIPLVSARPPAPSINTRPIPPASAQKSAPLVGARSPVPLVIDTQSTAPLIDALSPPDINVQSLASPVGNRTPASSINAQPLVSPVNIPTPSPTDEAQSINDRDDDVVGFSFDLYCEADIDDPQSNLSPSDTSMSETSGEEEDDVPIVLETSPKRAFEDFCRQRQQAWNVLDLQGHIVELCCTQRGSLLIQSLLPAMEAAEQEQVFKEIYPGAVHQIALHPFGNYVLTRFFEFGTPSIKDRLATVITGFIYSLSLSHHGCRVVQNSIPLILPQQRTAYRKALEPFLLICVRHPNGNHVVQKLIENIPPEECDFVLQLESRAVDLSMHFHGSRVIQLAIAHLPRRLKASLLQRLYPYARRIMSDLYGNFVMKRVLEYGNDEDFRMIARQVYGSFGNLARHVYASNVCDKLVSLGPREIRQALANELLRGYPGSPHSMISALMKSESGNYVLQKMVNAASTRHRALLVERVQSLLPPLRRMKGLSPAEAEHLRQRLDASKLHLLARTLSEANAPVAPNLTPLSDRPVVPTSPPGEIVSQFSAAIWHDVVLPEPEQEVQASSLLQSDYTVPEMFHGHAPSNAAAHF